MAGRLAGTLAGILAGALTVAGGAATAQDRAPLQARLPTFAETCWQELHTALALTRIHRATVGDPALRPPPPVPLDGPMRAEAEAAALRASESGDESLVGPALHVLAALAEFEAAAAGGSAVADPGPHRFQPVFRQNIGRSDPRLIAAALRGLHAIGDTQLTEVVASMSRSAAASGDPEAPVLDAFGRELGADSIDAVIALAELEQLNRNIETARPRAGGPAPVANHLAADATDSILAARDLARRLNAGAPLRLRTAAELTRSLSRLDTDPRAAGSLRLRTALVPELLAAATNPRPDAAPDDPEALLVRLHALTALGETLGAGGSTLHQDCKDVLGEMLRERDLPDVVRGATLACLGRLALDPSRFRADRKLASTLHREFTRASNSEVRGLAALAMGRMGGRTNRIRLLSRLDSYAQARPWIVLGLGVLAHRQRLLDDRIDRMLCARLRSQAKQSDPATQTAATLALGLAGDGRAAPALHEQGFGLERAPATADPTIAVAALLANPDDGVLSLDAQRAAMTHALTRSADPEQRQAAALALWALGEPRLEDRIAESLFTIEAEARDVSDAQRRARDHALLWALANVSRRDHPQALVLLLSDTSRSALREDAAILLSRALAPGSATALTESEYREWWRRRGDAILGS